MAINKLQDKIYLGCGKAARRVAGPADAYRPSGPIDPLNKSHRFLRLNAYFHHASKGSSSSSYSNPVWQGGL